MGFYQSHVHIRHSNLIKSEKLLFGEITARIFLARFEQKRRRRRMLVLKEQKWFTERSDLRGKCSSTQDELVRKREQRRGEWAEGGRAIQLSGHGPHASEGHWEFIRCAPFLQNVDWSGCWQHIGGLSISVLFGLHLRAQKWWFFPAMHPECVDKMSFSSWSFLQLATNI